MTRLLLAIFTAQFAIAPARAADPLPVWEIDTSPDAAQTLGVQWICFSPDGKALLGRATFLNKTKDGDSLFRSERLFAWDIGTRKEVLKEELAGDGRMRIGLPSVVPTRDGTVLVAPAGSEIRLSNGKDRGLTVRGDTTAVWFHPESRTTVWLMGELGYDLIPPDLAVGKLSPFENDPKKPVRDDWGTATLKPVKKGSYICAIDVSPDLTRVAVSTRGDENTLGLRTIETGEKLKVTEVATVPSTHRGAISVIRFSPDGKTVATGSYDSSVFLWDVSKAGKDWKPYATIAAGNFTVSCLAFSPDSRTLAAGTYDRKGRNNLFLIDARGGKLISARKSGEGVCALAYSPDGQTLVTGHSSGRVSAWDAAAVRGD